MPESPIVTALIPTRNRAHLLSRAVSSVLNQSERRLVVHVFDNASTDDTNETVEVLATRDSRVRLQRHPINIGALANFQSALRSVRTPFFSILSDDDVISPCLYARAITALRSVQQASVFFSDVLHVTDGNKVMKRALARWRAGHYPAPLGLRAMSEMGRPEWTGAVFRTEHALSRGPLVEPARQFADVEFTLRAVAYGDAIVDCTPGAVFNISWVSRSPYPFQDLTIGCDVLRQVIDGWTAVPRELRAQAVRPYLEEFNRGELRRLLTYLVADMRQDVDLVARYAGVMRNRRSPMQLVLRAACIAARIPLLRGLLARGVQLKRAYKRCLLPTFDEQYCVQTGVPRGLLSAWMQGCEHVKSPEQLLQAL
jgi:glycosyltransferase involved in cell wall biosynthesis